MPKSISIKDHVRAIGRAEKALAHLERHPGTRLGQLGAARDQLNIARNWHWEWEVWDAVEAIEGIVLDVYGTPPADND